METLEKPMKTLEKILYAEDDKDIRLIVQAILKRHGGYTIEACDTGLKALDLVNEFEPDLIILDVNMPDMDGPSAFKELKKIEKLRHVPVIFMTAKVQHHEIDNYYTLGVDKVIIKPFNPSELVPLIEEAWRESLKK